MATTKAVFDVVQVDVDKDGRPDRVVRIRVTKGVNQVIHEEFLLPSAFSAVYSDVVAKLNAPAPKAEKPEPAHEDAPKPETKKAEEKSAAPVAKKKSKKS